jgi:hypothetical protein
MNQRLTTFADIIELWPSAAELARDLNEVKDITVRAWKARGIPAQYWDEVVASAHRRGFDQVSVEMLSALAAKMAGRSSGTRTGRAA